MIMISMTVLLEILIVSQAFWCLDGIPCWLLVPLISIVMARLLLTGMSVVLSFFAVFLCGHFVMVNRGSSFSLSFGSGKL